MIAPRTRGRIYLQSFMDAVITFSTFWAYLFVFILLQPGESRAQLEMLGAALVYSLTALAAVTLQGFRTIYSRPNWWRATWAMSHKLSLNQLLWAGLALCLALAAIGDINTSRLFLLSWLALLYFCLLLANRYLPRKIVETISDGRTERTILLGTFEAHPNLTHWRNHREASGSEVFEYIPDFSIQQLANLERVVEERNVTEIVLTETPRDPTYLRSLMELCDRLGTRCILLSEHAELFRHKVSLSTEAGLQFVERASEPLETAHNIFLKRLFDLILASLFSLLMFPAFLAMLLLLRILSPGPVFSREPRADINGIAFHILKFRVRHLDGRPFAFGQLLCRYSIDEWPQIFNVFKGEMSFVGPRPHWPEQNEAFTRVLQNRYFRSEVKPGITGLAQIRGFRGKPASDQEIARRLAADLEYIENWSFGLDCLILLKTGWPRRRP